MLFRSDAEPRRALGTVAQHRLVGLAGVVGLEAGQVEPGLAGEAAYDVRTADVEVVAEVRGEEPPVLPERNDQAVEDRPRNRDYTQNDDRRKRRRLHGEDDTDRHLRLARDDLESRHNEHYGSRERHDKKRRSDAPITDRAGHINLFPVQNNSQASNHKIAEAEAERARKKQELEDQYTMRFSNAAGRDGLKKGPWYAEEKRRQREEMDVVEGKDVWGRPDPSAKHREQARQVSNDPLAFMQQAQSQLKQAEDDRRKWEKEEQGRQSKYDRSEDGRAHV